MSHRFENVDGLLYGVVESGAGEPLILLHGFTSSAAAWREHAAFFAAQYRVIAIDLPGHGRSDAPPEIERYRMERVAADLVQILASLDVRPAHWLGYSMGGRLALYVARYYPAQVRSLILESASPGLAEAAERQARRAQDAALAERIENDRIPAFVAAWERLPLFATQARLPADVLARQRAQRLQNSARGLAGSLRGMGTGAQPSLWAELPAVAGPTLLLAGELDEKFAAINRRMAAAMPAAELRLVTDAGHAVHLEQPAIFQQLVLDFLRQTSEHGGQDLPGAEQDDEQQPRQRHLLEPRVEGR